MQKKIIYFDQNQPFLVVPAAVILLQLDGDVKIQPTTIENLTSISFKDESLYLLNLFPGNIEEEKKYNNFLNRYQENIRFQVKANGYNPHHACLSELKKAGFRLSNAWVDIAREMAINNVKTSNQKAERLIRAYQAQSALVFNSNHYFKINEFILKVVDEFLTGKLNHEVDTLAECQKKAEKDLEALINYWKVVSLRGEKYRLPIFKGTPYIALDTVNELNPFIDLKSLLDVIYTKSTRFIIEYKCRGHNHFIYVKDDKLIRKSYSERTKIETARFRAAKSLLKKI